jgi:hypothetical protein
MSARQETYSVCRSIQGWVVHTEGGHYYSGPHEDKEHAIAVALTAVREARPSQLRISSAQGEWKVEIVRAGDPASSSVSHEPVPPETDRVYQGAPHVGS